MDDDTDTFGSFVPPHLLVDDGVNGNNFCLISNRNEAVELLNEYKEDQRYSAGSSYTDSVNKFEALINGRWPSKKPLVTISKAEFIRSNKNLSTCELIDQASLLGLKITQKYIYNVRSLNNEQQI